MTGSIFLALFFPLLNFRLRLRARMRFPRITHAQFRISPHFTLPEIAAPRPTGPTAQDKKIFNKTVESKKL